MRRWGLHGQRTPHGEAEDVCDNETRVIAHPVGGNAAGGHGTGRAAAQCCNPEVWVAIGGRVDARDSTAAESLAMAVDL